MKLSLKKTWLCRLIQDLSPISSGGCKGIVCNGITSYGHIDQLPVGFKVACYVFAFIGAMWTMHCVAGVLASYPILFNMDSASHSDRDRENSENECTPNHVMNELANRMQLLEVAFKEQVFARETISREITDQSDVYVSMDRKLEEFLAKLDNISDRFTELEAKYDQLSSRVFSDEILITVIVVIVIVQMVYFFRPSLQSSLDKVSAINPKLANLIDNIKPVKKPSSNPVTPKHTALRNEMCVVCFHRDNMNGLIHKLTDSMLRHLEGVKVSVKPFYAVFSLDDIRVMPHVKLYVITVDLEARGLFINGAEKDLVLHAVKHVKSLGAHGIVVITNDEGSKNLTAHSVYNTSIRIIRANDCLQDLAANGKVFSIWQEMTSHQLSHLRRFVKTVLNAKLVLR